MTNGALTALFAAAIVFVSPEPSQLPHTVAAVQEAQSEVGRYLSTEEPGDEPLPLNELLRVGVAFLLWVMIAVYLHYHGIWLIRSLAEALAVMLEVLTIIVIAVTSPHQAVKLVRDRDTGPDAER
jgi:hypothetical protein